MNNTPYILKQMPPNKNKDEKIKIGQLIFSVLAAFFGVQSHQARERDFTRGKPIYYIVAGIIVGVLLVFMLYGIVTLIVHNLSR